MKCEPRFFKKKKEEEPEEEETVTRDDGCVCPVKKKKPPPCKMPPCPDDPRYQHVNITRRCYYSFVEYQKCARLLGDYPGCNYFLVCYLTLCPRSWIDKWFSQMEAGTFPRFIYPPKPIIYPDEDACLDFPQDPPPPPKTPC